MDPIALIIVAILAVLLVYLIMRGGLTEPFRTGVVLVLIIVIVWVILRMVGMI
jgi:hypothetical protein